MSRIGSVLLFLSGLSLFISGALRAIFGDWQDFLFVPVGMCMVFFVGALLRDISFYKELLTMRTTKHGMNMGVLILLTLALLVILNVVAVRMDKSFDVTKNELNSLSQQSKDILKKLDSEIKVTVFFSGQEAKEKKGIIGQFVRRYQDVSRHVTVRYVNARQRPDLTTEYKVEELGLAAFIEYKDKRIRISLDKINEEGITNAMIKATRNSQKTIYFIVGHGERGEGSEKPDHIGFFRKSLEDASYLVKSWNLLKDGKVPDDGDLVAVIGPRTYLVEAEMVALTNFAKKGGRILVAADPDVGHNITELAKRFGVNYQHNYIYDDSGILLGQRLGMVPVFNYSAESEITKKMPRGSNGLTIFDRVSVLTKMPKTKFTVEKIAWTHPQTYSAKNLSPTQESGVPGPHAVMMSVKGKFSDQEGKEAKDSKAFAAVWVGDSDFLTNVGMRFGMNRDLGLNVVASLLKEKDLVSIRPKKALGSLVNVTRTQFMILVFAFIIPLPMVLFSVGGWVWWRRRAA